MIRMTHEEDKNGNLTFTLCEHPFTVNERTMEEIGNVIFQAYQAGTMDTVLCLGYKNEVAEEIFERRFMDVEFDFEDPVDLRLQALIRWANSDTDEDDMS